MVSVNRHVKFSAILKFLQWRKITILVEFHIWTYNFRFEIIEVTVFGILMLMTDWVMVSLNDSSWRTILDKILCVHAWICSRFVIGDNFVSIFYFLIEPDSQRRLQSLGQVFFLYLQLCHKNEDPLCFFFVYLVQLKILKPVLCTELHL